MYYVRMLSIVPTLTAAESFPDFIFDEPTNVKYLNVTAPGSNQYKRVHRSSFNHAGRLHSWPKHSRLKLTVTETPDHKVGR